MPIRDVASQLVGEEVGTDHEAGGQARAALRVCARLGDALSVLAGSRGSASLLARAVRLAANDTPWLQKLSVGPNGRLVVPADLLARTDQMEAARGTMALLIQLLELLTTFIGETLTLRLTEQARPKAAPILKSRRKA